MYVMGSGGSGDGGSGSGSGGGSGDDGSGGGNGGRPRRRQSEARGREGGNLARWRGIETHTRLRIVDAFNEVSTRRNGWKRLRGARA